MATISLLRRETKLAAARFRVENGPDLGPLPQPFEATKVLAEASLRGTVQLEAELAADERQERCVQYLGGSTVEHCVDATLAMLEATTPPADPRDATIFDDYNALKEDYR